MISDWRMYDALNPVSFHTKIMDIEGIVCHLQNLNMTEPGLFE